MESESMDRETILYSDETKNTSKWLMALPQVHYYLAKPTQHMPRQWNFPVGLAASRHCVNGYKWDT